MACFVLAAVIVVDVLLHRRWDLGPRSALVGLLARRSGRSSWVASSNPTGSRSRPTSFRMGLPRLRLATATAIIVVGGPELVRRVRVLAAWLVPLAALGAVVLGAALPSAVLRGPGARDRAGATRTPGVRDRRRGFHLTRASGAPWRHSVSRSVTSPLSPAAPIGAADMWGMTRGQPSESSSAWPRCPGHAAARPTLELLAYGILRGARRSAGLEQVEHEALATFMADKAGVRVPEVVLGRTRSRRRRIACHPPARCRAARAFEPRSGERRNARGPLGAGCDRLHRAGISHGRLNASNVLVADDGPMLVDLSAATLAAPQSALDIDVAELLVACTVLVGPERALRRAIDAGWGDAIGRILPYLQRAALTPHLRDLARSHELDLKNFGPPRPPRPVRRCPSWRRCVGSAQGLLMTAVFTFAAYLLISKLADIGFGTIIVELNDADPAWLVVALLLAQSTFIANGISVRGAVGAAPPAALCGAAVGNEFINLTVPSSAGRVGIDIRFLQRMGTSPPQALAAGAADDGSETIVQIGLLLAGHSLRSGGGRHEPVRGRRARSRLLVAIGVAPACAARC